MLGVQGALKIVHRKVLVPTPRLVMVVVGLPGVVIVPEPLTNDHSAEPKLGVLAAIVAELTLTDWLGPALAVVGSLLVTTTLAVAVQPPEFVTVTVYVPDVVKVLSAVLGVVP